MRRRKSGGDNEPMNSICWSVIPSKCWNYGCGEEEEKPKVQVQNLTITAVQLTPSLTQSRNTSQYNNRNTQNPRTTHLRTMTSQLISQLPNTAAVGRQTGVL
jgi:hypothetical protein